MDTLSIQNHPLSYHFCLHSKILYDTVYLSNQLGHCTMNFSLEGLKQKYENKKKNSLARNIDFSLTEDEFIKLCLFLKENRICPYTGKEFVFTSTSTGTPKPHYPTLERINNNLGYSIGNCIWVCHNANSVKSKWESDNFEHITFTKHDFKIVQQILSSKDKVEEQLNNIYMFVKGETTVVTETKVQIENSNQKEQNNNSEYKEGYAVNTDVELAQMYTQFSEHCKQHVDFLLSFNEYKKLMNRKQCQLSMQRFDQVCRPSLYVIDKTKTVSVNNLLVVDLKIRHHLDQFTSKVKLDNKQLKRVFMNLGNKL